MTVYGLRIQQRQHSTYVRALHTRRYRPRVRIEGSRLLLTGATGGLGRAIATALAEAGASLVLSARSATELAGLAAALPGGESRHRVVPADLSHPGAVTALLEGAGELDGLAANAALPGTGRLESFSADELDRALRVNLEAPIVLSHDLAPRLAARGAGHIVFIASLAGKVASPRGAIYSATKFGLRGFAFGLREDLIGHGVGVSVVSPGFVSDAGMFHDTGVEPPLVLGSTTPEKVAKAVCRAIERNRSEITVAPLRQRLLAEFAYRHPEWAARVQRIGGADDIVGDLEREQAVKR